MACEICGEPSYTRALMSKAEWCREHYATHGTKERDAFLGAQEKAAEAVVRRMQAEGKSVEEIRKVFIAMPMWMIEQWRDKD